MTTSELKSVLKAGGSSIGTMISAFDTPEISRILKNCGFEWFFYDAEHGYPNVDRLYSIFAYARMCGIVGLLRIPQINKTEIFRAMDMGVDGIICPDMKNANEARELIHLSKYAPLGDRGVSMTRPHTGYAKVNTAEYMKDANQKTIMIVQMESLEGISNLDDILSVEGIDGVLVGPNDLSHSMGIPGQFDNPAFLQAVNRVISICKAHKKFVGFPNKNMETLMQWKKRGVQLLQWGSDVSILMSYAKSQLQK